MAPQIYTTRAAIENYSLTTIKESFVPQIESWIVGVSRQIMQYTGRQFIADEEESARLFSGDGLQDLRIDDCIEIELVEDGGVYGESFTTVPDTEYITLPANHGVIGIPIKILHRKDALWEAGVSNMRVTAKWGYAETVPDDIKLAATILVVGIINATRKDKAEIKSEKIGNYQVSYSDEKGWNEFEQVKTILESYKRLSV